MTRAIHQAKRTNRKKFTFFKLNAIPDKLELEDES